MCWVCRKFVRTCSLFLFAKDRVEKSAHRRSRPVWCSFLQAVRSLLFLFVLLFTAFFLFSGSGRLRKCENSPFGQSAFPCFCELAFFLLFSRLHCRRSERRPQQIVIEVGVRVRMLGCTTKGGGQSATRLLWSGKNLNQSVEWAENREENPHTQVRINKKNCRFFCVAMAHEIITWLLLYY